MINVATNDGMIIRICGSILHNEMETNEVPQSESSYWLGRLVRALMPQNSDNPMAAFRLVFMLAGEANSNFLKW